MTQETQSAEHGPNSALSGTDLSERRRSGVSRGPIIDIVPTPEMTRIVWSETGASPDRGIDYDRQDRGGRAYCRGLSRNRCGRWRSCDAADPTSGHARRQSRATFAVLVLP